MNSDDRYDSLFKFYAEKWGRDPRQVKRQARIESAFNPHATSNAGAMGLMQFMPGTWRQWWDCDTDLIVPDDRVDWSPYNPERSIEASCAYMLALELRFGSLRQALAAYNWGWGNMRTCLAEHGDDWFEHIPTETRLYVTRGGDYERETLT